MAATRRHGSFYHRNAEDCITPFFKKGVEQDFVSSSRMTSNQEVTIRLVCVPLVCQILLASRTFFG